MDDRERLIGLAAAPLAGVVAIIVVSTYGSKARQAGIVRRLDVSPSRCSRLALVALACAWFRKRLYLGIVFALYGLSIFNLHYWGFGVPFLLIGSWYLVRAYRFQQKLKLAKEEGVTGSGSGAAGTARRAQPNKRYTPPVTGPAKPAKPSKPGKTAEDRRLNGPAPHDHPGDLDGHGCAPHRTGRAGPARAPWSVRVPWRCSSTPDGPRPSAWPTPASTSPTWTHCSSPMSTPTTSWTRPTWP